MIPKLNKKLSAALDANGSDSLEVVNPSNNRTYVLVDRETHRQAMDALRRLRDRDAIAEGIAQMEAGEGIPLEQARNQTRQRLLARRP